MNKNQFKLVQAGKSGNIEKMRLVPLGVGSATNSLSSEYGGNSAELFDDDESVNVMKMDIDGKTYQ